VNIRYLNNNNNVLDSIFVSPWNTIQGQVGQIVGFKGAGVYPSGKYGTFARKYGNKRVSKDKVYSLLCYDTM
jgi:hypothetical protein